MIGNYLKVAFRQMIRYRFHTLVNLTGLAVGIACVLFISLYVYDEMSYDRFFIKGENIYRVGQEGRIGEREILVVTTPSPLAQTLREEFPEILAATRLYRSINTVLSYGEKSFLENRYYYTDPDFFKVFSYRLLRGNPENILQDPHTMVISESAARKYFGNDDPVGKVLHEADGNDYTVTGVMEDAPGNTHLRIDFLASSSTFPLLENNNWLIDNFYTYIRARDGTEQKELERRIRLLLDRYFGYQLVKSMGLENSGELTGTSVHFFLEPVRSIYLNSKAPMQIEPVGNISYIRFFSLLAAFILILAYVNFTSLSTARSFTRAREMMVRKVMGSQRRQIIWQIMTESVLLSLLAFFIALTLVELLLPIFNRLSGKSLTMLAFENWLLLPSAVTLTVLMGLFSGGISALTYSSPGILHVLRGKIRLRPRHMWLRTGLVIFQFSVAIGLVISTLVIYQQLQFIREKKLGFERENVLVVDRAYGLESKMEAFALELKKLPGISSSSLMSTLPGMDGWNTVIVRKHQAPSDQVIQARLLAGDNGMFETLGLKLIEGKPFASSSYSDTISVILNETAVNNLGLEYPVGEYLHPAGSWNKYTMKVTGAVTDFHFRPLNEPIGNLIITDRWMMTPRYVVARIDPQYKEFTLKEVADRWERMTAGQPFSYFFLDDSFREWHQSEIRMGELFTIFSVLSVIIACVGLLGMVSFLAGQRTREVGIRKAMGAGPGQIIRIFLREFLIWFLVAAVLAWPLAYLGMKNWLQNFPYRASFPWWTMGLAALITVVAALLTVGYQTWMASRRRITDTIRHE
ncbi:MAG TPA: FtsX-like permease family protein [Bacteroidetes bacterium]|nr:FtsX-like permease family protein [Bacteroidota bacterium]